MNRIKYDTFKEHLGRQEKEPCILLAQDLLNSGQADVIELYEGLLMPALNNIHDGDGGSPAAVWQEHIRSAIVRSILEGCYPRLLQERERRGYPRNGKKVLVLCPRDEYHEIGARMAADFFTVCGYDALFIGANTPEATIAEAVEALKPDNLAISVTNYYNLSAARKAIEGIRYRPGHPPKILAGGHAFYQNPDIYKQIGADACLRTFEDIEALAKEEA